jgi:Spy/CpxP family protein refolding chaperone
MVASSKTKARLVILSAFILGALAGGGAVNLFAVKYAVGSSVRLTRAGMLDEIDEAVRLDASQRAQVEAILKKTRQESQEVIKQVQPQLGEVRARTRAQIRAILTPEQQARYDEWTRLREEAWSSRRDKDRRETQPSPAAK